MLPRLLFAAVALAIAPAVHAAEPVSMVTLPIAEYLDLKKQIEKGSLTTLEETRLTGEWGKHLQITFAGATQGKADPLAVMREVPGMSLSACTGQALLKAGDGVITLLPTAPRFKVSCEMQFKNWDNGFNMIVLNSLFAKVEVKGAEPMVAGESLAERRISLQRAEVNRDLASEAVSDEPSVQAREQISVLPEETRFWYTLDVHNPARTTKSFKLEWQNGEVVSQLQGPGVPERSKTGVTFKLMPGANPIRVQGRLPGKAFKPLMNGKGLEYVMIDNHPLLSLAITGGSRHVSPQDARMSPSFAGARAYMVGANETFTWEPHTLDVFAALSYTVTGASYRYYASTQSAALIEAQFNIDNQGSPEIPIKIPGRATYLEVNGVAQALTKDKDDQLLLRLPSGQGQSVLVQYQSERNAGQALALIGEELARPPALMSNVNVTLQVPGPRGHVYAASLDNHYESLAWWNVVRGGLVGALFLMLFARMGAGRGTRFLLAVAIAWIIICEPGWTSWALLAVAMAWAYRHRSWLMRVRVPTTRKSWALVGLGVLAVLAVMQLGGPVVEMMNGTSTSMMSLNASGMVRSNRASVAPEGRYAAIRKERSAQFAEEAPAADAMAMDASAEDGANFGKMAPAAAPALSTAPESYQGLPAKITIPNDGYHLNFRSGMLDVETPVRLRFVTVANWLPRAGFGLFVLLFAAALWRERRRMQMWLLNTK